MKSGQTTAIAVLLIGLSVLLFVAFRPGQSEEFDAPGQTWSRSSPFEGRELRLLDSGRFVARDTSDVTSQELTYGTWSRRADRFELSPATKDKKVLVLRMVRAGGCPALVLVADDGSIAPIHPYSAYFQQSSSCRAKL